MEGPIPLGERRLSYVFPTTHLSPLSVCETGDWVLFAVLTDHIHNYKETKPLFI